MLEVLVDLSLVILLRSDLHVFLQKYFEIWNAFKEKKFGIGKLIWCIYGGSVSFEEMTAGSQIIVDIRGSDNQRIFSVLGKHSLDVEYRCTNQDCPDPTMINTDPYKVLPIYETDR
ncbi:MAG: hypothetical protein PSN35_07445 [Candidatus Thioglobus sp.]|uniref:hypothetical protein n=1 Tax=Candidatus Thioglobus sp. TaxID=2026721 RepID=UPI00262B0BA8|nr:hypothetical protein [Candidatus Thioglobus sp.]MDC9727647.1 hypothetical protein [Candidatus Thioglobus sp.]